MEIKIDRQSKTPLYLQIRNSIRSLIMAGNLPEGYRLPSERTLAQNLSINRSTVVKAYEELEADDLVESHVGRGTTVKSVNNDPGTVNDSASFNMTWKHLFSRQSARMQDPLITNILNLLARQDIISLAAGAPSPELYPNADFASVSADLHMQYGSSLMEYGPTPGQGELRAYLVQHMRDRGTALGLENIMVTSGSQQALDLITRVFIEPGDTVFVEEPSYMGALQVFSAAGARLVSVPMDKDGLRTDVLEQLLARNRPKFIYTLPTYQNPSGITLNEQRRRELLKVARAHHVPIVEDDIYSDIYFDRPVPSLKSADNHEQVIYISSFSKIVFPGLRLGWVAAPAEVVNRLVLAKQLTDLHSNTPAQLALAEYCNRGLLEKHLSFIRAEYALRCGAMLSGLKDHSPAGLKWSRPAGGFYIWCTLPEGISSTQLLVRAVNNGVAFVPGEAFYTGGEGSQSLRLSFSRYSPEKIRTGVEILCSTLKEMTDRGPRNVARMPLEDVVPLL